MAKVVRKVAALAVAALLVAPLVVAGCALFPTTPAPATPKPTYTMPPPTPTWSPVATVAPTGHGRPYTAEEIAVALRENVGYTFPPQLQEPWVARALAELIWTYDGRPYQRLWMSGDCGDRPAAGEPPVTHCSLSVQGLPTFAPTTEWSDSYTFEVDLASGVFTRSGVLGLRGFPPDLVPDLDRLARSLDAEGRLNAMDLRYISWALPPPDDAFHLRYQFGGLEDAIILIVTLDRAYARILSIEQQ